MANASNSASTTDQEIGSLVPSSHPSSHSPHRVTIRSVLLGLLLIPPSCFVVAWLEEVDNGQVVLGPYPTSSALMFSAIVTLLGVMAVNRIASRLRRRPWMSPFELLTVYVMATTGSLFAGVDLLPMLIARMAYFPWFLNQGESQLKIIERYLPTLGLVTDFEPIRSFYEGASTLYTAEHLRAWIPAASFWLGYICILLWVTLCTSSLLRRQWSRHERLSFPITQLPLALTTQGNALLHNRALWLGFGIAASIGTWNGLSRIVPTLPYIPVTLHMFQPPSNPPWHALGLIHTSFYPWVIGLGFMLAPELLFSVWFFYIFWRVELVVVSALGLDTPTPGGASPPYVDLQSFGAYVAIIGFALWAGRWRWWDLVANVLARNKEGPQVSEAMPDRVAVIGILAGISALVLLACAFGMSLHIALVFMMLYLFSAVAVTRVRAELGPPAQDFPPIVDSMISLIGPRAFSPHDLTALAYFNWNTRIFRPHPMPEQMEGLRMAERAGGSLRGMGVVLLLAGIVGAMSSFWALLHLSYQYGAGVRMRLWLGDLGHWIFIPLASNWLDSQRGIDSRAAIGAAVGCAFASGLLFLRTRFLWWPFHPIGFAMSGSYIANWFWLPLLISWAIKSTLLRYGGLRLHRQFLLPFAYGLIIGDFIPGSFWALYATISGTKVYSFFP